MHAKTGRHRRRARALGLALSFTAWHVHAVAQTAQEQQQSQETQPQETQPQETQPQETQSQETQPQETQPQETQSQEQQLRPNETDAQPASGDAGSRSAAPAAAAAAADEVDVEHQEAGTPHRQCTSADVLRGLCTNADAAKSAAQKLWRIMGRAELVLPVVFDRTPETETLAYYYLGAEVDLPFVARGLFATAWLGVVQRFWRYEGRSNADFVDPFLGIGYRHSVPVGARELIFVHRFSGYFPASRPSRHNPYYSTLDWVTALRYPFQLQGLGSFMAGANVWAQYTFQQHATHSSDVLSPAYEFTGGASTRMRFEGGAMLQYTLFDSASVGNLLAQGQAGYRQFLLYDGTVEPSWYWALALMYTPLPYLSATAALEHGYSDMLRGGARRFTPWNRDETVWRVGLFARY